MEGLESESDRDYSSDEEFEKNRIGNVPLKWYEDSEYVGRDISGRPIAKKDKNENGLDTDIENLLKSRNDPAFRRTIFDEKNQESIMLTNRELNIVRNMLKRRFVAETKTFDPEPDYSPYFSSKILEKPVHFDRPVSKKQFQPSKSEKKKIIELIRKIREGKIRLLDDEVDKQSSCDYMLWDDTRNKVHVERKARHIPAPKRKLPTNSLSYHPPKEYLSDDEDNNEADEENDEPKAKDYSKLRYVPAYKNLVREEFDRCLDLNLSTRKLRMKLNIDPNSLVPVLPKAEHLRPFPNTLALSYFGHGVQVRSFALLGRGRILVSGDTLGCIKIWEVETCRCLHTLDLIKILGCKQSVITQVCANPKYTIVSVLVSNKVVFIDLSSILKPGDKTAASTVERLLEGKSQNEDVSEWKAVKNSTSFPIYCLELLDTKIEEIKHMRWHKNGLYFVTVYNTSAKKKHGQLHIHHLERKESQRLLSSAHAASKLDIQVVCFHPTRPFIFISTKQNVFCYDMLNKCNIKRLNPGSSWVSSIEVHPSGDHVILGGFDKKVNWIDLDLKDDPFKSMKFHTRAVRDVAVHKKYPLIASASDDGSIHLFHAKVYEDIMRNALIVPVKKLKAHYTVADIGVFQIEFHPTKPWIVSSGGDGNIHLFQNIW